LFITVQDYFVTSFLFCFLYGSVDQIFRDSLSGESFSRGYIFYMSGKCSSLDHFLFYKQSDGSYDSMFFRESNKYISSLIFYSVDEFFCSLHVHNKNIWKVF